MLIQSFIVREGDEERRSKAVEFLRMIRLNRDIQVEVKEYKRDRSLAQNRLLWTFYNVICKDIGYEPEELHSEMKARVLGCDEKEVEVLDDATGELRKVKCLIPRSTTRLKVAEMTRFLEAVEVLAASLGIALPHPIDLYDEAFGRKSA